MPRFGNALVLPEIATPATPSSGTHALYFKSDGKAYQKDPSGTESLISSGGSGSGPKTLAFKVTGTLSAGTGVTRLYNDTGSTWTINAIRAFVETPPSGGSLVLDVKKNGSTLFTSSPVPTITSGNNTTGKITAIDVTSVLDGDYLTVDITTATSPVANLTLTIVVT